MTPLSYADATPIMANLGGPETPRGWQGALPFTYHVGPGPVKVHLSVKQNYLFVTIWDVLGVVRGSQFPDEWVLTGNHRDAWVYGAVDPNSGTAAQLEAVHGIGAVAEVGMASQAHLIVCQLGCRRRRPDRLDGICRAACQRDCARRRLLQHGRRGCRSRLRRIGGAQPEAVHARHCQVGSQSQRRQRLRPVEADGGEEGDRSAQAIPTQPLRECRRSSRRQLPART